MTDHVGDRLRPSQSRNVLVVDDDPLTGSMYALALEQAGFGVSVAASGKAALASLAMVVPDVVVTDWRIGATTGAELLNRMRLDGRARDLGVVFLSGFDKEQAEQFEGPLGRDHAVWLLKSRTTPAELVRPVPAVVDALGGGR